MSDPFPTTDLIPITSFQTHFPPQTKYLQHQARPKSHPRPNTYGIIPDPFPIPDQIPMASFQTHFSPHTKYIHNRIHLNRIQLNIPVHNTVRGQIPKTSTIANEIGTH